MDCQRVATTTHDGWIEAAFTVGIDWAALEAQGGDPDEPISPFGTSTFLDAEGHA